MASTCSGRSHSFCDEEVLMNDLLIAAILTALIFIAGTISIELGLSAAIIEIVFGVIAGNLFNIQPTPWLTFIASTGGILLTFLAGTEVNIAVMREKFKESLLIGGLSFLLPFLAAFAYTYYIAGWTLEAAKIAGVNNKTIRRAVLAKKIRYKVAGNRYLIDLASLIKYIISKKKLVNKFMLYGLGQYVEKWKE